MKKISLPFTGPNAFEGLAEVEGIISLDEETISIEFQTKDSFFGVLRSAVKKIKVKVADVEEIGFQRGIFGNTLSLRSARFDFDSKPLSQLPGEVRLSIARRHRDAAGEFARSVKSKLFDLTIKEFE